jgi:hypothetical protein
MSEVVFAVFLIGLGIATAPEVQKEAMRRAARAAPVKILGSPVLVPVHPVRIIPPLKKMENK